MGNNIYSSISRDDRISRYLKGLMDAQEESRFLADMKSDDQLRQNAIVQARLVRGMTQVDNELVGALKEASETEIVSSIHLRRVLFRKSVTWLSIAASIVVLLFAGYKGYDYYNTTNLGIEYAKNFPMKTIVRGGYDSIIESELQTLFDNVVERKNLAETNERLLDLWQLANRDTYNDYTDYSPYIGWYLAIGYLEDYEKDKAIRILEKLRFQENQDNALIKEVDRLLDRI